VIVASPMLALLWVHEVHHGKLADTILSVVIASTVAGVTPSYAKTLPPAA